MWSQIALWVLFALKNSILYCYTVRYNLHFYTTLWSHFYQYKVLIQLHIHSRKCKKQRLILLAWSELVLWWYLCIQPKTLVFLLRHLVPKYWLSSDRPFVVVLTGGQQYLNTPTLDHVSDFRLPVFCCFRWQIWGWLCRELSSSRPGRRTTCERRSASFSR